MPLKTVSFSLAVSNLAVSCLISAALLGVASAAAQPSRAIVREYEQAFPTYPFGDPNPIPVVGRIYPYFRFDGFAFKARERKWKVVELENEYLRVMILPEIGGKIWNAVDKRTGRSFIYFNRAVKFRDIAMRGPWTSGGIEANYGIIGHTPNVATPVDYLTRSNADGSVSCVIGALDLLTRTSWRLEVRLAPGEGAFSTSSSWYNSSPLEQPYYSWMNVGIKVAGNLQFVYPGTSALGHGGEHGPWPVDASGRDLSWYDHNDFGGYKSYHVFGREADFIGAYWHDDDFGMVRYSPRDEKAGKKIWIWGLSRQGMIWEQLLTDADGQYAEVQSGRLFNQSVEQSTMTPFKHRGFAPHTADRWTEYWYPVAGTGGFVAAGRAGALNVTRLGDRLVVAFSPVVAVAETLSVYDGARRIYSRRVERQSLELFTDTLSVGGAAPESLRVAFGDGIVYRLDPRPDSLSRPLDAPAGFDWSSAYGHWLRGKEWIRQREYSAARASLDSALGRDPNFVPALADRAMLAIRSMEYDDARRLTARALSVDTYDGASNYYYGLANRRLGRLADAKDGFEIAAQSPEFRGAAWTELARLSLADGNTAAAAGYADKAIGAEGGNLDALGVAIVAARLGGDRETGERYLSRLETVDPLSHQARFERLLVAKDPEAGSKLADGIRSELPGETLLELAAWYADAGDTAASLRILEAAGEQPEALYWRALLLRAGTGKSGPDELLNRANGLSPTLVFPFRQEIVPALEAAARTTGHWKPSYYLALAYWGIGRIDEAGTMLRSLGDKPDYAPFYAARASFPGTAPADAQADLRRAGDLDRGEWRYGDLLSKHLLTYGDAKGAVDVARRYRDRFPDNYIIGLTLAKALVAAGEYGDADALLAKLDVLPYEGAADGRALYRQAKLMLAVEAIGAKDWKRADELIAAARLWPERLGAGKPYDADTDERLEDWLQADAADRAGNAEEARKPWERLSAGTMTTGTASDALKGWSLERLGRPAEAKAALAGMSAGTYTVGADGAVIRKWLSTHPPNSPARETASAADTLWYGTGRWEPDSLGNHRAVLRVSVPGDAVYARIPWRRRDRTPEKVNLVVASAATGARVRNIARFDINREFGDIAFQATAAGDYYVYYLPYTGTFRSPYPKIASRAVQETADSMWLVRNGLIVRDGISKRAMDENQQAASGKARVPSASLPRAAIVGFDAVDRFSRFTPMEYIATGAELNGLISRNKDARFLAFAEDRGLSIRMTDDIPRAWAERGAFAPFHGEAMRGEFYAFQIGVWAHRGAVDSLRYRTAGFTRRGGAETLPASAVTSINFEGVDWSGKSFTRVLRVDSGKVQPLWFGVDIPPDAVPGDYEGAITLSDRGGDLPPIGVVIRVGSGVIASHGDDEPDRLTRLRWLDSRLADDDSVVAPFIPLRLEDSTASLLGRTLSFGPDALPSSIRSFFSPNNTAIVDEAREILKSPVRFAVVDSGGTTIAWAGDAPAVTKRSPGTVEWEAAKSSASMTLETRASLEFDGTAEYRITLRATGRTSLSDVRLEIPLRADAAKYMMGLGRKGGYRGADLRWKWDVAEKNQDAAWIGDVNAGLQFTLKDDRYVRPLNTNFYLSKPLVEPRSWANGGKGGVDITGMGDSVLVVCYGGARVLEAGDSLRFDFRLMITPFKTLDTRGQWDTRYFHAFVPVDSVASRGANTINVHHANRINPWINYPFLEAAAMRAYVDSAHALGLKAKIYYTVRELTNHAPELFALRSLGDEVLSHGPGGGGAWLQEHLGTDYIGAWHVFEIRDAAIVNSGVSRWHNFYVEGLNWLVRNEKIDGLYLDDVAFDRLTMKRVRRVLDRGNPGSLIDLHSANQYNPRDGFASSANLYLEHFPFLNRLWFGEYFDYDSPPDYWLVEISGIPFGLMGEMLENGGHPWRGMTFGMTARLPWAGDPAPLWKAWDDFGVEESRLQGWWSGRDPVSTGDSAVLATTWIKPGSAMVALGSWRADDARVRLSIDWKALGLDPSRTTVRAPAIPAFQVAGAWGPGDMITVPAEKGLLLILEQR